MSGNETSFKAIPPLVAPCSSPIPVRKVRHREAASDFNAALAEYRQYLLRATEAAEMRAAAEAAETASEGPEGGAPSDQGSFRLEPGETLRLPTVKVPRALHCLCVCQQEHALRSLPDHAMQNKRMRVSGLQALQTDRLTSRQATCKSNAPPLDRTQHVWQLSAVSGLTSVLSLWCSRACRHPVWA